MEYNKPNFVSTSLPRLAAHLLWLIYSISGRSGWVDSTGTFSYNLH